MGGRALPSFIVPALCFSYHSKRNSTEPIIEYSVVIHQCKPPTRFRAQSFFLEYFNLAPDIKEGSCCPCAYNDGDVVPVLRGYRFRVILSGRGETIVSVQIYRRHLSKADDYTFLIECMNAKAHHPSLKTLSLRIFRLSFLLPCSCS